MKFSHAIIYAINAMLLLAEAGSESPIPCRQIARAGQMPERFLLQVLRTLVTRGLLHSTRGVDGGYYLAKSPREINLCDIVDAFDNPLEAKLPDDNGATILTRDKVIGTLRRAAAAARSELERMTLAELIERPESLERAEDKVDAGWPRAGNRV